jgi:hypothetical protein
MKIKVWTLATEGDNTELSVSVHATEKAAYDTLRSYLDDDIANAAIDVVDDELSDVWADYREGVAVIECHELEPSAEET